MAAERVRVNLVLNENFTGRMAAAAQAAQELGNELALRQATWEPHDWSDL